MTGISQRPSSVSKMVVIVTVSVDTISCGALASMQATSDRIVVFLCSGPKYLVDSPKIHRRFIAVCYRWHRIRMEFKDGV
jgi:hypothetical protein